MDRILSIISKKFRQWQNTGLTQHSAGSSQLQPENMWALNSDSGQTNPKQNKVSEKLTNKALRTRNFWWKFHLKKHHPFLTHFLCKYSACQHIISNKIFSAFLKIQSLGIAPQECSHHGSLPSQYHPGAAVNCTWSLCTHSCPLCRQPAVPPEWCGMPRARSRRLGPAPNTSSGAELGRMLCRCRISAHLHHHLSAEKEITRFWDFGLNDFKGVFQPK